MSDTTKTGAEETKGLNQHLFNALVNICGFTALQTDMQEIISAVQKDHSEQKEKEASIQLSGEGERKVRKGNANIMRCEKCDGIIGVDEIVISYCNCKHPQPERKKDLRGDNPPPHHSMD